MPEWTEIQRVAWALGALDAGEDVPADTDTSNDAENFRQWAERVHADGARQFIAAHEALQTARFGPETSPHPFRSPAAESPRFPSAWVHCSPGLIIYGVACGSTPRRACECEPGGSHDHLIDANWLDLYRDRIASYEPGQPVDVAPDMDAASDITPDTADQFARQVRRLLGQYPNDPDLRAAAIADLAVAYAGQFLPGCLAEPARPAEAAVAGPTFKDDAGYYVAVMTEGTLGCRIVESLGRFGDPRRAQVEANAWNRNQGVTVDDILRVAEGIRS